MPIFLCGLASWNITTPATPHASSLALPFGIITLGISLRGQTLCIRWTLDTDNEVANPPRHLITSNVGSSSHGTSNHGMLSRISPNARCFRGMNSCHYHSVLINPHAVVVLELVSPQSHSGVAQVMDWCVVLHWRHPSRGRVQQQKSHRLFQCTNHYNPNDI
jgi:hypothetical protein